MASRKVIVTIAPTGGMAKKAQNPHLPTQPREIAAETIARLQQAGPRSGLVAAYAPENLVED